MDRDSAKPHAPLPAQGSLTNNIPDLCIIHHDILLKQLKEGKCLPDLDDEEQAAFDAVGCGFRQLSDPSLAPAAALPSQQEEASAPMPRHGPNQRAEEDVPASKAMPSSRLIQWLRCQEMHKKHCLFTLLRRPTDPLNTVQRDPFWRFEKQQV